MMERLALYFSVPVLRPLLFTLLLFLSMSSGAHAGSITITPDVRVRVEGEKLRGTLRVTNLGNASAHRVRVDLILPLGSVRMPGERSLGPGVGIDLPVETSLGELKKGTHPLGVVVQFEDDNGQPFSALGAVAFPYRQGAGGRLRCKGMPLIMEGRRGNLVFEVQNPGDGITAVKATLLHPREFSASKASLEANVPGGGRKALSFALTNQSALSGAAYPAFCLVEYDEGGLHHTVVSHTVVRVMGRGNPLRDTRWYWAGGLLLFSVLGLWGILSKKSKSC